MLLFATVLQFNPEQAVLTFHNLLPRLFEGLEKNTQWHWMETARLSEVYVGCVKMSLLLKVLSKLISWYGIWVQVKNGNTIANLIFCRCSFSIWTIEKLFIYDVYLTVYYKNRTTSTYINYMSLYRDKSYIYLICKRICNVQVLSRDLYSGIEATLANSTRSVTINVKDVDFT